MDCSVCCTEPGERTHVECSDSETSVTLPVCEPCYDAFAGTAGVTVSRVGP